MSGRKPKKKASPSGASQSQKDNALFPRTDIEDLFSRAFDTEDLGDRRAILRHVLEFAPNHFHALFALAELTPTAAEGLLYARRAFAIVAAAAGDMQPFAGRVHESEHGIDYVTCRSLLALALLRSGAWDEGEKHAFELLDLRPGDDFGVHAMFLKEALAKHKWDVADAILLKCSHPETDGKSFIRALLEFARHGDSDLASKHLTTGIAANKYIVPLMLKPGAPTQQGGSPRDVSAGSMAEAEEFAMTYKASWWLIPSAIAWLRTATKKLLPAPRSNAANDDEDDDDDDLGPIATKEEMQALRLECKRLPRIPDESWVVDVSELSDGTCVLMVLDSEEILPLFTEEFGSTPNPDDIMWHLFMCMVEPEDNEPPHRPGQVEFLRPEVLAEYGPKLRSIGIDAALREDAAALIEHFAKMDRSQPLPDEPLTSLPQVERERWELDWRQLETWMTNDFGDSVQPWIIMVVDPKSELVINVEPLTEEPTEEQIFHAIRTAAFRPAAGAPHRPASIRVGSGDQRMVVADWLEAAGITCDVGRFKLLDALVDDLAESVFGSKREGLTESENIPLKLVGELYEHAAAYFRLAPWDWMAPAEMTELRCPALSPITWIAVGMGQMGEGLGIMLFDDAKNLRTVFELDEDPAVDNGGNFMRGVSVSLEEKLSASPADVAAADQFGWPVAAPDAWPVVTRVKGTDGFEPVNQEELQIIIAALQIVPKFWKGARGRAVKPADFPLTISGKSVIVKARQFIV